MCQSLSLGGANRPGIGSAAVTGFWPLLLMAFVGTLNPSAGDVSVFLLLEQTALSGAVAIVTVPTCLHATARSARSSVVLFGLGRLLQDYLQPEPDGADRRRRGEPSRTPASILRRACRHGPQSPPTRREPGRQRRRAPSSAHDAGRASSICFKERVPASQSSASALPLSMTAKRMASERSVVAPQGSSAIRRERQGPALPE